MLSFASAGARLGLAAAASSSPWSWARPSSTPTGEVGGSGGSRGAAAPARRRHPDPHPTLAKAPTAPCDATDTAKSCLAAGTYQLTGGPGGGPSRSRSMCQRAGSSGSAANGYDGVLVDSGAANRNDSGWGVMFATVGDVSRDPCDSTKGT